MDFLKTYWRPLSLIAIALIFVFDSTVGPGVVAKELQKLLVATIITILASEIASAFETRRSLSRIEGGVTRLTSALPGERLMTAARGFRSRLSREDAAMAWRALCETMDRSYCATLMILPETMYSSSEARAALAAQYNKVHGGAFSVSKVLIYEQESEGDDDHIRRQVEERISWRKLRRTALPPLRPGMASADFAIFDGKVVLCWKVDEKRGVESAELVLGEQDGRIVQTYEQYFLDLLTASEEIVPSTLTIRPVRLVEVQSELRRWPQQYLGVFRQFSYLFHPDRGWLATYGRKAHSVLYGAFEQGRLLAFAILDREPGAGTESWGDCEGYLAVHPGRLNEGLGELLALYCVKRLQAGQQRAFIRVRLDHPARAAYERLGFRPLLSDTGQETVVSQTIEGEEVKFNVMVLGP